MRSLGERLNLQKKLVSLKYGPGAAILPPRVTRIHMDFANRMGGGHMGPRKFWQECLPRLKYHNPHVPMIVNRHDQNGQSPVMSIYLHKDEKPPADRTQAAQPASSWNNLSKAQPPSDDETVIHIDMKEKHSSVILEFFMAETMATPVQPHKDAIEEIQQMEALKKQSVLDRERVASKRKEEKREADMLRRARAAFSTEPELTS